MYIFVTDCTLDCSFFKNFKYQKSKKKEYPTYHFSKYLIIVHRHTSFFLLVFECWFFMKKRWNGQNPENFVYGLVYVFMIMFYSEWFYSQTQKNDINLTVIKSRFMTINSHFAKKLAKNLQSSSLPSKLWESTKHVNRYHFRKSSVCSRQNIRVGSYVFLNSRLFQIHEWGFKIFGIIFKFNWSIIRAAAQ